MRRILATFLPPAALTVLVLTSGWPLGPGAAAAGVHIVVLGSSTAAGTGASVPDSAWVNRYRNALVAEDASHQVTNLARGGYTTYHIMPTGNVPPAGRPLPDTLRNITRALSLAPDAVIINLPSNDAAYGYTLAEQLANYDSVLAAAGRAGVPVWISTTQPRNLTLAGRENLMAMRDSTFARWGDHAIDFWNGIANPDGTINVLYNSGDGIHLNDAGHRILFERAHAKDIPAALVTAVIDGPGSRPATGGVWLGQNEPNPLAGSGRIRYELAQPGRVVMRLYDLRGRRLATLEDAARPAGRHSVACDGSTLPSGSYFYELRTEAGTAMRRMTVVR